MKRVLWFVVMLGALLPFNGFAAQYALLVGIDAYPAPHTLAGCVQDAQLMQQVLTQQFGFPAANIKMLTDQQATLAGIQAAFETHLIGRAQSGDVVVFYYSGHGTQTPDHNGDEDDDIDETLVALDTQPQQPDTWLTDDRLGAWLARLRTDRVTVILDACFSGTATRADEPLRAKTIDFGFYPSRPHAKMGLFTKQSLNHVLLAASASDQTSLMLADEKGSVFTRFLYEVLVNMASDLTYDALMQQVLPRVTQYVAEHFPQQRQTPQLEGNGQSPVFFRQPVATVAATPTAPFDSAQDGPGVTPAAEVVQYNDFRLNLTVNKPLFYADDLMVATLEAGRDCYVRLYVISANQEVQQLFPNKWQPEHFITAGQTVQIPPDGAKFRFRMAAPFGTETLKAVASTAPFEDLQNINWEGKTFLNFSTLPLSDLNSRGVITEGVPTRPELSQAVVMYEIRQR